MGFALLLLGLVPLILMGDIFMGGGGDANSNDDDADTRQATRVTQNDNATDILKPVTDDPQPFDPDDVDPATVITPTESDPEWFEPNDVDPQSVLVPIVQPGEGYQGGGTALQQLIAAQSDHSTGVAELSRFVDGTDEIGLGEEQDIFSLPDDGVDGTGQGALTRFDGTPVLISDAPIAVLDAGGGDDGVLGGDAALYAFGGAGNDIMIMGEGAAAFFGGEGDDILAGGARDTFLDGGSGDDLILGGAGNDILSGGSHAAGGDSMQDNDRIDGGAGDDVIRGGFGADVLSGGEGDDIIDHLGRVEQDVSWSHHQFDWHIDGAADTLDGGPGNDTLIMDRNDSAMGGDGMDSFIVYYDEGQGTGFADIGDFETGLDFLKVELNPNLDYDDMEIFVGPSTDGQDGVVMLNGEVVAMLRGAPDANVADVLFSVTPNITT